MSPRLLHPPTTDIRNSKTLITVQLVCGHAIRLPLLTPPPVTALNPLTSTFLLLFLFLMVIWARTCTVKLHTFHIQSKNKRLKTPKLEACSRICSALTAWLWIIWGWRAYCIYTTAVGITLCYFTWKLAFSVVFSNCYSSFYFHKLSRFLLISFTHTQKKRRIIGSLLKGSKTSNLSFFVCAFCI